MICNQTRLRIRLAVAAYAYEYHATSLMSDHEFDRLSLLVDKNYRTGNDLLDDFFAKHFEPATGNWVRFHPEKDKLHNLVCRIKEDSNG